MISNDIDVFGLAEYEAMMHSRCEAGVCWWEGTQGRRLVGGFNHVDILWIQKDTNSDERFPLDGAREGSVLNGNGSDIE